jgi:hypothetical protein
MAKGLFWTPVMRSPVPAAIDRRAAGHAVCSGSLEVGARNPRLGPMLKTNPPLPLPGGDADAQYPLKSLNP